MNKEIEIPLVDESKDKKENGFSWDSVGTDNLKKPEKIVSDLDNLMKSYGEKTVIDNSNLIQETTEPSEKPKIRRRRKKSEPVIISGEILTGTLFLTLIDLMLPMLISTINNVVDKKGKKISPQSLKLSQTQINELTPIADAVMKEIELKANPIFIMVASLLSIYGMNFLKVKYE